MHLWSRYVMVCCGEQSFFFFFLNGPSLTFLFFSLGFFSLSISKHSRIIFWNNIVLFYCEIVFHGVVQVIRLSGVLATPVGGMPGGQARRMLYLDRVEKWISKAFFKPLRPDACAIIVNSPGGSPVQSELIHEAIRTAAKDSGVPVFTFAEDVAASGGYWLMCAGDESFACSTSLVGSIGVVSATFGAVEAAKKLGIERRVYASGEDKVPLDPFLPVSSEQVSHFESAPIYNLRTYIS